MRPLAILDRTRIVLFILIGYCVLHFIVRLTVSPVFSLDEAEQMLFSQDLQWGYRFRHPPLITWLTALTQEVFGLNRWSFFALKYAIMAGGFVALFFAAQEILKDTRLAASATFLWGLTYVLGWYPHADLMHTVLLTSLLAACLHAFTRILNHGGWLDYTYFGITLGLGFLAKYVFAILPVIGLVALLFVPKLAERVHWYRLSAAFFIAA
ncbi:MAG: glycosyltransferase family 39 protein, partial [Pseudomonadota bacterium]